MPRKAAAPRPPSEPSALVRLRGAAEIAGVSMSTFTRNILSDPDFQRLCPLIAFNPEGLGPGKATPRFVRRDDLNRYLDLKRERAVIAAQPKPKIGRPRKPTSGRKPRLQAAE